MSDVVEIEASGRASGEVVVPGDKSISHRALLLGALGEGQSRITGLSQGEDVAATALIISELGAGVSRDGVDVLVEGGRSRLHASSRELQCGNSGTTMRLVMGLVAGIDGSHTLVGDASLSKRPMDRVAIPLEMMGASVAGTGDRLFPPVTVKGGMLRGVDYTVPVPSAQVKSAVLLAGLFSEGNTVVTEASPTRPNTEEMLQEAGVQIDTTQHEGGTSLTLHPGPVSPRDWVVPCDPSQAAFFVVAALLAKEGFVVVHGLYGDRTRIGFLGVLERMGGVITRSNRGSLLDVTCTNADLSATTVHSSEIPSVDEVPILAVAAAAAEGVTRFVDVGELRIKESDRFATSIALAQGLGARAWGEGDDLLVEGLGSAEKFSHLTIDAHGDHRVAMAGAIGGFVGSGATISGFEAVATSFPGFLQQLEGIR